MQGHALVDSTVNLFPRPTSTTQLTLLCLPQAQDAEWSRHVRQGVCIGWRGKQ